MTSNAQADTRLQGRWLTLARILWIVLAVFYIGAYFAALPTYLAQPREFSALGVDWTDASLHAALGQLGLSLDALLGFEKWSNVALACHPQPAPIGWHDHGRAVHRNHEHRCAAQWCNLH